MRNNVWLTIEHNLAISWKQWVNWFISGQEGPEPPISDWDKKALTKLVDLDYSYRAYKKATIPQLAPKDQWDMLNVYDIKIPEWIEAGFNQHGEATQGGDIGVAGVWRWEHGGDICVYDTEWPWLPNQVLKFMPDVCTGFDATGTCTGTAPASEIIDVSLLFGQPPRYFPEQPQSGQQSRN